MTNGATVILNPLEGEMARRRLLADLAASSIVDANPRLAVGHDELAEDLTAEVPLIPVPTDKTYTAKEIDAMLDRALTIHQKGLVREAMDIYREVLLYDRSNKRALYFSAIALSQSNDDEARVLTLMRAAAAYLPNAPEVQYNLGIMLHRIGLVEESIECFAKAVKGLPNMAEAKTSLGGGYLNLGDKEKALYWLRESIKTYTSNVDSIYSRAFSKMLLGDYVGGLADYDKRWKTASFLVENRRSFGKARHWNGKPIPGQTLYIHTEQGAGDVIMLSRFIEKVAARSQAGEVILEVGDALVDLLSQVKGVDFVIPTNSPVPDGATGIVHAYLPMMGVLRQTGFGGLRDVPHGDGWLLPLDKFRVTLPPAQLDDTGLQATSGPGLLKVGISWAGSKAHKNDRYRSIVWSQFRDVLLRDPRFHGRVAWYSFQVGDRARDIDDQPNAMVNVFDLTGQMTTFAHTADAAAQMDLMICVDTATVHVAGALRNGPPVWMLVPAAPDWRWGLTGDTTPWYTRLTMFRQDNCRDWATPLTRVADALHAHLEKR